MGCKEIGCDADRTTGDYCRLHYLKNWKQIQTKKQALTTLKPFANELLRGLTIPQIKMLRKDLSSDESLQTIINWIDTFQTDIDDLIGFHYFEHQDIWFPVGTFLIIMLQKPLKILTGVHGKFFREPV